MSARTASGFEERTIDELAIEDERSFRLVPLYAALKETLRRDGYRFRIMPRSRIVRWDRALFLNLTFWGVEGGGDVLVSKRIAADVVTHVAWHHLAKRHLEPHAKQQAPCAASLFLGEAIASAFDLYLVGRLLNVAPQSSFLETQVPAMAEAAHATGLSERGFQKLLVDIARDPQRAFEDLRQLLCDATAALVACTAPEDALTTLSAFDTHRFAPLLHRYELSNWILFTRAYARPARTADPGDRMVRTVDRAMRKQSAPLDWLAASWLT